jgi:hypothetical protein
MHVQELEMVGPSLKLLFCIFNDGIYSAEIHKLRATASTIQARYLATRASGQSPKASACAELTSPISTSYRRCTKRLPRRTERRSGRHGQIAELQPLVHGSSVEHVDMTSGFSWSPISRSSACKRRLDVAVESGDARACGGLSGSCWRLSWPWRRS